MTSGGTKAFFIEKKIKRTNKIKRFTIARYPEITVEEARRLANEYIGDMVKGKDPSPSAVKAHQKAIAEKEAANAEFDLLIATTLEKAFSDYLDNNTGIKDRTAKDYKEVFYYCLGNWLQNPINDIDDDVIEKMHKQVSKKSKARANYALRIVRAVFNFAIGHYKFNKKPVFTYNPVPSTLKTKWHKVERRHTLIKEYQLPV